MTVQSPVRKVTAALIPAAAVVAAVLPAAPASAHYSQCPPGKMCLWEHTGYEGRFQAFDGTSHNIGSHMNDRTTSIWNRTNQRVSVYLDSGFGTCLLSLAPGSSVYNLNSWHNDRITSIRVDDGTGCTRVG
ncbi:hypothetical protein NUM3379_27740 [Kineococcus sp. NUM-3379]